MAKNKDTFQGKPWKIEAKFKTYEEAKIFFDQLNDIFYEKKIKYNRQNDLFVIKLRKINT